MKSKFSQWIIQKIAVFLSKEIEPKRTYLSNFDAVCHEIKPCDVLLFEGRTRLSRLIKILTQSPWSHAALYVGKLKDIDNPKTLERIKRYYSGADDVPLLIESLLGKGTIVSVLSHYKEEHIRILRPSSLLPEDVDKVITFAARRLGSTYNIRHVFDLARFLFPWNIFPRRWRSSLFSLNAMKPTEDICSSMLAFAFGSVGYPILPLVQHSEEEGYELTRRNPRLFTPSDFDFSPYFDIIKYPIFGPSGKVPYRSFKWRDELPEDPETITPAVDLKE